MCLVFAYAVKFGFKRNSTERDHWRGLCQSKIQDLRLTLLDATSGSFASPRTNSLPAQHVSATMPFRLDPGEFVWPILDSFCKRDL
jgi:hypothetical protein